MASYYECKISGFRIVAGILIVSFDLFSFFQRKIIFTYYLVFYK